LDGSAGEGGDGENEDKGEFVPTVFVPRPYDSEFVEETEREVDSLIVKNERPLMKVRLSKRRRDFGNEARNLIDKEAGENPTDVKQKNLNVLLHKKRVLTMGLQASRKLKTF